MTRNRDNWPAWSNVPTALVADRGLSQQAKSAASALGIHTNAKFQARVSVSTLADTLGVDERTMKRGLKALEVGGWITVERVPRPGKHDETNLYEWNFKQAKLSESRMKKGRAVRPPTGDNSATPRGGETVTPRGDRNVPVRGDRNATQTSSSLTIGNRSRGNANNTRTGEPMAIGEIVATTPPEAWHQQKEKLRLGRNGDDA